MRLEIIREMVLHLPGVGDHGRARLLGVDKERGAIRPGYAADIIATPQNPLDDILALRQVKFVMKDGKVFRN